MRFMAIVRATAESESGAMPREDLLAAMGRFNEELVAAGVMLGGEGLQPSAKGVRVRFDGAGREVIAGPFEPRELIAGYWILQTDSLQACIEWIKRSPNPFAGESEIEIRQIFEAEDFGAEFSDELRAQEERLRARIAGKP